MRVLAPSLVGIVVLLVGCVFAPPVPALLTPRAEPAAAAAFIAAHAAGDDARSAAAVSPLFRFEMERRGRWQGASLHGLWSEALRVLELTHVGGVTDADGFAHLLYTARPRGKAAPVAVWRVDLDPLGRVIWGEPARLLEGATAVEATRRDLERVAAAAVSVLPSNLSRLQLAGLAGVRGGRGDGYYALSLSRTGTAGAPDAVAFVGVDADGVAVPDFWSYGRPTGAQEGGFVLYRLDASDQERDLLRAYLARLW